jgi:hypothetical protein
VRNETGKTPASKELAGGSVGSTGRYRLIGKLESAVALVLY